MLLVLAQIVLATNSHNEDLVQFTEQPAITSNVNFYERLSITSDEQQKIDKILTTMADNSIFQLLFERKYLERLGQEVHHVHPLRFLGTIFSKPHLVNCMFTIRMSGFKWGGFIDGITQRLKGEIKAGNVDLYIPGLAEQLNINPVEIQAFINRRDVEGLILFLMEKKRR